MTAPRVITPPNPLPADIDWARIENTLGVTIVQGHPSDAISPLADDHDSATTSGLDFDDRYRDARRDEDARVLRVRNVDPSRAVAIDRVLDSLEESGELLVIVDPVLVRAVEHLLSHDASIQSVDRSPEPSGATGPASPDPETLQYGIAYDDDLTNVKALPSREAAESELNDIVRWTTIRGVRLVVADAPVWRVAP